MFLQPGILDQMHDAVIVTDLDGTITGCNRAVKSTYGYEPEELIGQCVTVLYPPDEIAFLRDTLIPLVHANGEFRGELRNLTRSGDYTYVHLSVALLHDAEGRPAGMVGFSINVTLQKLAELAVQREKELELRSAGVLSPHGTFHPDPISLAEALRIAEIGTWEWDCINDRVRWSEQIYRLFDHDNRLPPLSFQEQCRYYTPETTERLLLAVRGAIELFKPFEIDIEIRLPNEGTRWAVARGVVQASANGRATHLCDHSGHHRSQTG